MGGGGGVVTTDVAQDRDKWWVFVKPVLRLSAT